MQMQTIIAGEFCDKVIPLIEAAKTQMDICVFDWRWYGADPGGQCQKFNQAIVAAAKRGVKIRALVNSENIAVPLRKVNVECRKFFSKHLLHLKMIVIDDKIVITGSHNYTQSAMTANYELSVILEDVGPKSEFSKFFERLWQSQ